MVEVAVVEETEKQEAVVEVVVEEVLAAARVVLVVDIVGVIDMSIRIQKKMSCRALAKSLHQLRWLCQNCLQRHCSIWVLKDLRWKGQRLAKAKAKDYVVSLNLNI